MVGSRPGLAEPMSTEVYGISGTVRTLADSSGQRRWQKNSELRSVESPRECSLVLGALSSRVHLSGAASIWGGAKKRRIWRAFSVRCCLVQTKGKDGETHSLTLEASSVFDAADKAINRWARLWWFSDALITVQSCEERWIVSQERVRKWKRRRNRAF